MRGYHISGMWTPLKNRYVVNLSNLKQIHGVLVFNTRLTAGIYLTH